jgi:ankyrin repeat protein
MWHRSTVMDPDSPLLIAIFHRRLDEVQALLEAGTPVGPLEAAALGDVERLRGADVNARSADGFTLLHLAAFFGGAEAVRVLLAAGAPPDADAVNRFRVRPLHSASAARDLEAAQALLAAGADPNLAQQGGYTALHTAAHNGHFELVRLLLEHGADLSLADEEGKIPRDMTSDAELRALLSP